MKKLFIILGLFIAFAASGQNNYTAKAYQSLNADSTTVRNYCYADSAAGRTTGWIWMNRQATPIKWRYCLASPDTVIFGDLVSGGGGGGVTGWSGLTSNAAGDSIKLGGSLVEINTNITGTGSELVAFESLATFSAQATDDIQFSADNQIGVTTDVFQITLTDAMLVEATGGVSINGVGSALMFSELGDATVSTDAGDVILSSANDVDIDAAVNVAVDGSNSVNISSGVDITQTVQPTGFEFSVVGDGVFSLPNIAFVMSTAGDFTVSGAAELDLQGHNATITANNAVSITSTQGATIQDDLLVTIQSNGGPDDGIILLENGGAAITAEGAGIIGLTTDTGDIVLGPGGDLNLANQTGAGTRMLTVTATGNVSNAAIPAGISGLTAGRVPYAASATTLTDSPTLLYDPNTNSTMTINGGAGGARYVVTSTAAASQGFVVTRTVSNAVTGSMITDAGAPIVHVQSTGSLDVLATAGTVEIQDDASTGASFNAVSGVVTQSAGATFGIAAVGNVNITAVTSSDVNITGNDDVNIVAEGDDIVVSALDDIQITPSGDLQLGSSNTDGLSTSGIIYSSTYTPTLTGITNVTGSSASVLQYARTGNYVQISGTLQVTPTVSVTTTTIALSVPVASNFSAFSDAGGTGVSNVITGTTQAFGLIQADATNDRLELTFSSLSTGSHTFQFSVGYLIR